MTTMVSGSCGGGMTVHSVNHDSVCCVVVLILYIHIDFIDLIMTYGSRCVEKSTSESAEAQRDGTLWRGLPQHRM